MKCKMLLKLSKGKITRQFESIEKHSCKQFTSYQSIYIGQKKDYWLSSCIHKHIGLEFIFNSD